MQNHNLFIDHGQDVSKTKLLTWKRVENMVIEHVMAIRCGNETKEKIFELMVQDQINAQIHMWRHVYYNYFGSEADLSPDGMGFGPEITALPNFAQHHNRMVTKNLHQD